MDPRIGLFDCAPMIFTGSRDDNYILRGLSYFWLRRAAVYSEPMRVKLLVFGVLKDLLGVTTEELDISEGSTVGDLLRILEGQTSNVTMDPKLWKSVAVAVNREYSSAATVLRDGDEVALLPPVSGGYGGSGAC